eukprot:2724367-Rhodomonas_salina.1
MVPVAPHTGFVYDERSGWYYHSQTNYYLMFVLHVCTAVRAMRAARGTEVAHDVDARTNIYYEPVGGKYYQ